MIVAPHRQYLECWSSTFLNKLQIVIFVVSKLFCVDFIPGSGGSAYKIGKEGRKIELWRLVDWQRVAFLSNDGKHLAACHAGLNLIPTNDPEQVMISLFNKGKLEHQIKLKALIGNLDALRKTVSHYDWGSCIGLRADGRLRVNTVEDKQLYIDLATGKISEK